MKIKELGHVVLYVSDIKESVHFYRDILGFPEVAHRIGMSFFSSGRTHHELLLIEIGKNHKKTNKLETGLYHIAFKIGDKIEDLKKASSELKKMGIQITGASDHNITKGIYLRDPDGNEIELYIDCSKEWKKDPGLLLGFPKPLKI